MYRKSCKVNKHRNNKTKQRKDQTTKRKKQTNKQTSKQTNKPQAHRNHKTNNTQTTEPTQTNQQPNTHNQQTARTPPTPPHLQSRCTYMVLSLLGRKPSLASSTGASSSRSQGSPAEPSVLPQPFMTAVINASLKRHL
jgi:hypothetical protein